MATAAVTPDNDAVLAEVFIAAPPERVFQAITDPSRCHCGGDNKACIASLSGKPICARAASGKATASEPTATLSRGGRVPGD